MLRIDWGVRRGGEGKNEGREKSLEATEAI